MRDKSTVIRAANEHNLREHGRSRPSGGGHRGRWYPSQEEHRSCCNRISPPSRQFPLSLHRHCRTAEHVAQLFGVDVNELKEVAERLKGLRAKYPDIADPVELIAIDDARAARDRIERVVSMAGVSSAAATNSGSAPPASP